MNELLTKLLEQENIFNPVDQDDLTSRLPSWQQEFKKVFGGDFQPHPSLGGRYIDLVIDPITLEEFVQKAAKLGFHGLPEIKDPDKRYVWKLNPVGPESPVERGAVLVAFYTNGCDRIAFIEWSKEDARHFAGLQIR